MAFYWEKLGRIYNPAVHEKHHKLRTHSANPLPVHLQGNIYRIFYSGRDDKNRSSVGAVDIDIVSREIIKDHFEPFFENGPTDSFYSDGVSIGNCYEVAGVKYMLFMGWITPAHEHWKGLIGSLTLKKNIYLELTKKSPLMENDKVDPISLSYPWVLPKIGGGYHMWYGSTVKWDIGNKEMLHVINYASSIDGFHWERQGQAVPHHIGVAQAFSRPSIIFNPNTGYDMWFSYRGGDGDKYRIGYASSVDELSWELKLDQTGIDVSEGEAWDSEMIEYPYVFEHDNQVYMLYNGNSYGKTGFGLAVLKRD